MLGEAIYSPCMRYRYALTRPLRTEGPRVLFVMLNPSTATHDENDPTVTRAIGFAQRLGAARLDVCNCFGFRSTDPIGLRRVPDPQGVANTRTILARARYADRVVVAWGNHAGAHGFELAARLAEQHTLWCLGVTGQGQPKHPLYLRADTPFRCYEPAQAGQSP
ncbi:MAG: DUF1643 domain-containing protein [Phycisphaerales bacterium]